VCVKNIENGLPEFNLGEYVGQSLIALTYDDGLTSHFDIAAPLHLRYGIPATFAVVGVRATQPQYWHRSLNPFQITELARQGFEIASHGLKHVKRYADMTDEELDDDLLESKKILEGFVPDGNVNSICIPYASYNARIAALTEKHYELIRTSRGMLEKDILRSKNPLSSFVLKRETRLEEVTQFIDSAVKSKRSIALAFHGVSNKDNLDKYDVSDVLLEGILKHIKSIRRAKLLPICLRDLTSVRHIKKNTNQLDLTAAKSQPSYVIVGHKKWWHSLIFWRRLS
jgi:peptidoglycan/xylan/chitin deacetylase (PgdA/CDA1 family)